jgi:hypothetical protein
LNLEQPPQNFNFKNRLGKLDTPKVSNFDDPKAHLISSKKGFKEDARGYSVKAQLQEIHRDFEVLEGSSS